MRLGALLLTGAALLAPILAAQGRKPLAWECLAPLDWQAGGRPLADPIPAPPAPSTGPVVVSLSGDGTLRVRNARGVLQLQAGLPGRPLHAWRDGGLPLPTASGEWRFPDNAPLKQGLGGLHWAAADFRPFLEGLLWVLEDGEAFLTVVHPGTARVIHLPLPPGRDLQIRFLADRLEVLAGDVEKGAPRQWSLPWIGLLPRLAALGPHPSLVKPGTALAPFPKD